MRSKKQRPARPRRGWKIYTPGNKTKETGVVIPGPILRRQPRYRDFRDEQWAYFLETCAARGLDPLADHIRGRLGWCHEENHRGCSRTKRWPG
jgi:hypothetical protein